PHSHETATTTDKVPDGADNTDRAYVFPASFAQERLWFLHQFEPGSYVYNIPTALRLAGSLIFSALWQSMAALVERHETLRTRFVTVDGRPLQSIALDLTIPLPLVDLSTSGRDERDALIRRIATDEACRPFDLARGPLVRTTLLRLDSANHILLLTFHHTIADAWSLNICFHELNTLYSAFAHGQSFALPELPIQYADYAVWQRDAISHHPSDNAKAEDDEPPDRDLTHELAYWKKQLAGTPSVLELPFDHPRPAIQTYHGAKYQFTLPASLTSALEALCHRQNVTLFMALLAAFATFLSRLTGQQDILVGTPIAGRTQIELEGLIGFFANTLVMRCNVPVDSHFLELLQQVRDLALEAYAHQEIPFDRVVETLQPERSLSYNPIFQVLFSYQNMPPVSSAATSAALQLEPLDMNVTTSKFDLSLYFSQDAAEQGGLFGEFEYNTDLFEEATIARWATHLQTLLTGITAYPRQLLLTLPLLEEAEQQQLLDKWSVTTTLAAPNLCLHQLFEAQVERTPHAIALSTTTGEQITYAEANQRANRLAHYLIKTGVGPEKRVAILLDRSPDSIITILAILKAGGAYVPVDPAYPAERLAYMLADVQVSLLITSSAFLDRLPGTISHYTGSLTVLFLDRDAKLVGEEPETNANSSVCQDNLAYIIFTSGSTGKPKGVGICHRQVTRLFAATGPYYSFTEQDTWTFFHSMAFDFSVWEIWGALLYGGRLVVVPYWVSRSPAEFVALLAREQVTVLNQTPSAFYALQQTIAAQHQAIGLSLRFVIFGGEALDPARLRSWMGTHADTRPQLVNMYGITETTVHVTSYPLTRDAVLATDSTGGASIIGTPLPDLQIYLLDTHMHPVPTGIPGEMYVSGAGLARGYIGHPELTAVRFVPHPFSSEPGARLYKTGDLARFLPDGTFAYQGRADHQVKLRGFRIELGEIETALIEHPQIQAAAVLLRETHVPNVRHGEDQTRPAEEGQQQSGAPTRTLVAYIVPEAAQTPAVQDIRAHLHRLLPEYMIPASFVLLEALPLTPNGKLDRRALPAPASGQPALEKSYLAPRTLVEKSLAAIWSQVLGLQKVGIHDNFFELGGDSILSMQIVARATAAGLPLTPRHLFQHQSIAQLALVVGEVSAVQTTQDLVLGPVSLTPIQHWFFDLQLPDLHHWNQTLLLLVQQPLNPTLVQQAVQRLLIQHD
ncbi:MAG TPA: amino acid adenylation domain-containing protein, partial [Ktedonobacteraceae bacterium]|nr:amino acid adenylation domain-containing protein [Ktedonobacteraceae bacterium]